MLNDWVVPKTTIDLAYIVKPIGLVFCPRQHSESPRPKFEGLQVQLARQGLINLVRTKAPDSVSILINDL